MTKKLLFCALSVVFVLSGCADDGEGGLPRVTIVPRIQSRVTGMHFDAGDSIGLTITRVSGDYVTNRKMIYDGTAFAAGDLLWYNDLHEKSTLTAYFPYTPSGMPREFTVASDQRTGCASSDLLAATKADVTPGSAAVGMVFYHLLSQLSVLVTNTSDAAVSEVEIGGLIPVATIDYTALTAGAKSGATVSSVKAFAEKADELYRAVLVPQQAALTVTVRTTDGKSREKSLPSVLIEGGTSYDMAVTVTNIDIDVTLSGEIQDWKPGGDLDGNGGQGANELVYEDETYRTVRVGDKVWMAQNMRNIPAAASISDGVWYPGQNGEECSDPEYVAACGMLYDYATATGGAAVRAGTFVRGICPEGWHIPDWDEMTVLMASDVVGAADFASYAGGWNAVKSKYFAGAKGYLMSSSKDDMGMVQCLMLEEGKQPIAKTFEPEFGLSVRCVRDY